MPRGQAYAQQGRDDVRALVSWLDGMTGGRGPCPREAEIAQHFRVSIETAGKRLRRAVEWGLIRLHGRGNWKSRRLVEILAREAALPVDPVPSVVSRPMEVPAARGVAPLVRNVTFAAWLAGAAKGDRHVYFVGHLAEERGKAQAGCDHAAIGDAARAVHAAEAGLVILVTQRDGDGFAYTAVRTAKLLSVQP